MAHGLERRLCLCLCPCAGPLRYTCYVAPRLLTVPMDITVAFLLSLPCITSLRGVGPTQLAFCRQSVPTISGAVTMSSAMPGNPCCG